MELTGLSCRADGVSWLVQTDKASGKPVAKKRRRAGDDDDDDDEEARQVIQTEDGMVDNLRSSGQPWPSIICLLAFGWVCLEQQLPPCMLLPSVQQAPLPVATALAGKTTHLSSLSSRVFRSGANVPVHRSSRLQQTEAVLQVTRCSDLQSASSTLDLRAQSTSGD